MEAREMKDHSPPAAPRFSPKVGERVRDKNRCLNLYWICQVLPEMGLRGSGRARKGERAAETTPKGHWKVSTTLGTMSLRGIDAAMTVDSATAGETLRTSGAGAGSQATTRRRPLNAS